MEARTWHGENAVDGVYYNPLPLHPQTEEERERTMHYSLNLVNRRERGKRDIMNYEEKEQLVESTSHKSKNLIFWLMIKVVFSKRWWILTTILKQSTKEELHVLKIRKDLYLFSKLRLFKFSFSNGCYDQIHVIRLDKSWLKWGWCSWYCLQKPSSLKC